MLVLGLATATDTCAVGLVRDGAALADLTVGRPRAHATLLGPLVEQALEAAGVGPADLDGIAVAGGPGSYTGLRIGVSFAKGLCLASGARLLAVPTLAALAADGWPEPDRRTGVVLLPSRRGEVYAGAFKAPGAALRPAEAVAVGALAEWAPDGPLALLGPAAARHAERFAGRDVELVARPASGVALARLGAARLADGRVESVDAFEPAYLKPFVSGDGRSGG